MFFMYPFLLCITSLAHFSCFVLFYSHNSHLYHLPLAHSLILKAYASAADPFPSQFSLAPYSPHLRPSVLARIHPNPSFRL